MTDKIDDGIEGVEAKEAAEPNQLIADFVWESGETMKLAVPIGFNADQFETAVGVLMQLRVAADARKAMRDDGLLLPDKPHLVHPSGGRLT